MRKTSLIAFTSGLLLAMSASVYAADVGKAASEATDAAKHKIDQKRAEKKEKESGPVGKAVNDVKGKYHENRAGAAAENAKDAMKK